jgi:hypothetical protein
MKNNERITGILAIMCGGAIIAIAFHLAATLDEERKADLRTVMDEWATRHGLQPTFRSVKRTGKITVIVLDEDGDWKIKEEA